MAIDDPKFDVALSFLVRDQQTATAINRGLINGLEVFFFPHQQEELAGTDGLESMRDPFINNSRVMVVLYREPWGRTPWTGVEETAIKEACLDHGWDRLFFLVLDQASALPKWLPKTHVRFNLSDYGLDGAIGAIKARVQNQGGKIEPLSALKRAQILRQDENLRIEKARLFDSVEGVTKMLDSARLLFETIQVRCYEITRNGLLRLQVGLDVATGNTVSQCVVTDGIVSMVILWLAPGVNSLRDSELRIQEFDRRVPLPGEGVFMHLREPKRLRLDTLVPELSRARQLGWIAKGNTNNGFIGPEDLAERLVIDFIELSERASTGKLRRDW